MAQGLGARTGTVGGGSTVRTTSDERTTILAIVEGRERVGRGNIGIAVVDPQRAACRLYQVSMGCTARGLVAQARSWTHDTWVSSTVHRHADVRAHPATGAPVGPD